MHFLGISSHRRGRLIRTKRGLPNPIQGSQTWNDKRGRTGRNFIILFPFLNQIKPNRTSTLTHSLAHFAHRTSHSSPSVFIHSKERERNPPHQKSALYIYIHTHSLSLSHTHPDIKHNGQVLSAHIIVRARMGQCHLRLLAEIPKPIRIPCHRVRCPGQICRPRYRCPAHHPPHSQARCPASLGTICKLTFFFWKV